LQVLEGPAQSVLQLYEVISRDERHTGVNKVFRQPILARDLTGCSLAYQEVSSIGPDLDGYAEFSRQHFDIGSLDTIATNAFLQLFKRQQSGLDVRQIG
jgi:hypothetical protein